MTLRGIDVSRWQTTTPDLTGVDFLIARASVGLRVDDRYAMHIANARRAGLVVGAYAFGYGTISIDDQLTTFLEAAGDVDLYAFDVEGPQAPSPAQTGQFFAGMHAAGKGCGLYHSDSGFFAAGQDWNWIANWSGEPVHRWDIWQHRGSPLDLDRFDGTVAELRALGDRHGGTDVSINTRGLVLTSDHAINLPAGTAIYDQAAAGAPVLGKHPGGPVSYHGSPAAGWKAVRVDLGSGSVIAYTRTAATPYLVEGPPAPDCSAVEHELAVANARIRQATIALGGTPA